MSALPRATFQAVSLGFILYIAFILMSHMIKISIPNIVVPDTVKTTAHPLKAVIVEKGLSQVITDEPQFVPIEVQPTKRPRRFPEDDPFEVYVF
jgi:hypothetical protein